MVKSYCQIKSVEVNNVGLQRLGMKNTNNSPQPCRYSSLARHLMSAWTEAAVAICRLPIPLTVPHQRLPWSITLIRCTTTAEIKNTTGSETVFGG